MLVRKQPSQVLEAGEGVVGSTVELLLFPSITLSCPVSRARCPRGQVNYVDEASSGVCDPASGVGGGAAL